MAVDEVLAEIDATGRAGPFLKPRRLFRAIDPAEHLSFYMTLFGKDADVWIQYDGQKDGAE